MPPRDWTFRISDMLEAIAKIARHTAGMTRETFAGDEKTIDAVQLNLVVIGEAASHVPDEVVAR